MAATKIKYELQLVISKHSNKKSCQIQKASNMSYPRLADHQCTSDTSNDFLPHTQMPEMCRQTM